MDPASMSGTQPLHISDESPPAHHSPHPPSPPHHRRHIRYATPEIRDPPPAQFILERPLTSARNISATPTPPPAIASPGPQHQHTHPGFQPDTEGQDHDRMEMDDDSDESESSAEDHTPEPEPRNAEMENAPPPPPDAEVMDTSPDHHSDPRHPELGRPHTSIVIQTNPETGESTALRVVTISNPGDLDAAQMSEQAVLAAASAHLPPGLDSNTQDGRVAAAERELVGLRRDDQRDRARTRRLAREVDDVPEGVGEDSEDSTDEEEHPYWTNLREDDSSPDEQELEEIEKEVEFSALDHDHWEELAYQPLDDPEYVPAKSGRITWTVHGVRGTAEKPNRETIMRSPSVFIDGYYWNIKYYPRGKEGTDHMSIYIECSTAPYEEVEHKASDDISASNALPIADQDSIIMEESHHNAAMPPPVPPPHESTSISNISGEDADSTTSPSKERELEEQKSWSVAAQVGCIIYNPDEPRVYVYDKGSHRYYQENPEYGWVRFNGEGPETLPWEEIHKRRRLKRQALLRNDTLSFTVYIRTVGDETNALWWSPPDDKPKWNSLAMTGIRAFECQEYQSSAMIAALSAWLHLIPVVDLIHTTDIPDAVREPETRMRPVIEELQDILNENSDLFSPGDSALSLSNLVRTLNFYGAEVDRKMDVVMIWETLRRIINLEFSDLCTAEDANGLARDNFREVLLLKQPDLMDKDKSATKYQSLGGEYHSEILKSEPRSVMETLIKASQGPANSFRVWQSFAGQLQIPSGSPSILQVELHRQDFDKVARKWKKLTHQIKIDEDLTFKGVDYCLYGIIVHAGGLESTNYYSVIRPEGPGTRWLKYADETSSKGVSILTTRQAIDAHEGGCADQDGTAAVAYIVIYARTDIVSRLLCTPFHRDKTQTANSNDAQGLLGTANDMVTDDKDSERDIPVYVHGHRLFEGYSGRGVLNPWFRDQKCGGDMPGHKHFFTTSTTLQQMKKYLEEDVFGLGSGKVSLELWPLDIRASCMPNTYPQFLPFKDHSEDQLGDMILHSGGCRFWMALKTTDPVTAARYGLPGPSPAPEIIDRAQAVSRPSAELSATRPVTEPAGQANGEERGNVLDHGDTEMAEASIGTQETSMANDSENVEPHTLVHPKEIYFFLKLFDAGKQTLRGINSHFVRRDAKVSEEAKRLLKVDLSEEWDFYHERHLKIGHKDLVGDHETFEYRFGDVGGDGNIIIAQRRPPKEDISANTPGTITSLEAEGKCANPIDFFQFLRGLDNPSYFRNEANSSYFGWGYRAHSLKGGRAHGNGVLITPSGDFYDGDFVAGRKRGQGSMYYANGDTYKGEWEADEPNGQGRMEYVKHGNVYTGGFKKRKRFGKGTMEFNHADEEDHFCHICWENEIDTVFLPCGHLTACEDCARQMQNHDCPLCRKVVKQVVKVWRV